MRNTTGICLVNPKCGYLLFYSKYTYSTNFGAAGTKQLHFSTWSDFELWKQTEEDATYTSYITGQQTYCPQAEGKDELNPYQHLIIVECVLYRDPNTLLL